MHCGGHPTRMEEIAEASLIPDNVDWLCRTHVEEGDARVAATPEDDTRCACEFR